VTELEGAYLSNVYRLCHREQVLFHHCQDSRKCSGAGLPDLLIVGPNGLIFREVKVSPFDVPTSEQKSWLYMLQAAGADARVWTSTDLQDGTVAKEIASIAKVSF
jgi:hypothetical protein